MLFLHSAQLVLRSSVLEVLELNEVNVMLKTAEILGQCCLEKMDLLMTGYAVGVLPSSISLSCPLLLQRIHPPSLLVCCFFLEGYSNASLIKNTKLHHSKCKNRWNDFNQAAYEPRLDYARLILDGTELP